LDLKNLNKIPALKSPGFKCLSREFQSRALSALTMLIWVIVTIRSVFPVGGEVSAMPVVEETIFGLFDAFINVSFLDFKMLEKVFTSNKFYTMKFFEKKVYDANVASKNYTKYF
jgi:hypothetical protein